MNGYRERQVEEWEAAGIWASSGYELAEKGLEGWGRFAPDERSLYDMGLEKGRSEGIRIELLRIAKDRNALPEYLQLSFGRAYCIKAGYF